MRAFVVIASAGRQLLERVRAQGDLIDPPAADVSGCRDTRWLVWLAGCQGLPEQIAALCRTSIVCVLARPARAPWPRPGRTSSSVFVGRHLVVRSALLREPAAVNTARGSRRPRRCRCGEEFRGPGRRIAAALGRRHSAGWPCPLTCVETWRSSGEAVRETPRTIAGHSPGAAAPTARSRAVPGMSAGLDVAHGRDRAHGRQLPPLSPPQRVNADRNLRHVPSERAGCPGTAQ